MSTVWLQIQNPDVRNMPSTQSVYKFKKAFITADAHISNTFMSLENGYSRIETTIEFEAKIPLRKPDRYEISAGVTLGTPAVGGAETFKQVLVEFEMRSLNVNRAELETWRKTSNGEYFREKSHQPNLNLKLPVSLSGLLLPAPLATRALADCWQLGVRQYNGVLLAGKKLIALRVRPQQLEGGDSVGLEVEFLKFDPSELRDSLEHFDHLRWTAAQKAHAVFSVREKVITRFELELPIFGALALQKIEF